MAELPNIETATYASNVYRGTDNLSHRNVRRARVVKGEGPAFIGTMQVGGEDGTTAWDKAIVQHFKKHGGRKVEIRRVVKVYIVDIDENVPLEKCVLHQSEQFLTDKTDEELFYDVEIKRILDNHNSYRESLVDKSLLREHGREVNLEPIRVSDLTMTVVEIASF